MNGEHFDLAALGIILSTGLCFAANANRGTEIVYGSNEAARRYVDVNGVKLYYEVYGQGQPRAEELEPKYYRLSPNPDSSSYVARTRDLWTGDSYPSERRFKTISIPVLLVCGDGHDLRLEHVMEMYRALSNAQLCLIPNRDHFFFEKRPALLNAAIFEFLEGQA